MRDLSKLFVVLPLVFGFLTITGCKKDEEPTSPGGGTGGGITSAAFPNNTATLTAGGGAVQGQLTGGTAPYSINTAPIDTIATAAISGANMDTLTITPVAQGTTSVVIEDSAPPAMGDSPAGGMVTISIVVNQQGGGGGTFAGTGTMTMTTSIGSFNASGTYNENATSGQGVGGLRSLEGTYDVLFVVGYNARSVSDADLCFVTFYYPNGTLMPGTYDLLPQGAEYASVGYGFNLNLANPAGIHVGTMGSAGLATVSQTAATGNNIAGSGLDPNNPTVTSTFSAGTFNVTGIGQGRPNPVAGDELEGAVMNAVRMIREQMQKH